MRTIVVLAILACFPAALTTVRGDDSSASPKHLRDILWVWGNPEMQKPGEHTAASFVEADSAQRAKLLGVPNIALAGSGLPNDDAKADALTAAVAHAPRLLWETTPDGEGIGPPFVYEKRMAQIRKLKQQYPQIEAILLDDMSTGKIDRGYRAEHVQHIQEQLSGSNVKVWGVVYTHSLGREHLADCINKTDVINLWMWDAKDTANLEKHVSLLENNFPKKPIVLGIYLFDYGGGRRMPLDLLQQQCETARKLAHAGRIEGIVFLTINNDAEAVQWVADWVQRVGEEAIRPPAAQPRASSERTTYSASDNQLSSGQTYSNGPNGTLLRALSGGGVIQIESSADDGKTWQSLSTIKDQGKLLGAHYFSQNLSDSLLLTVILQKQDAREDEASWVGWVRSEDGGKTWSRPTPILPLAGKVYAWGPIAVMSDGRWAYCPYHEEQIAGGERRFRSMIVWSRDGGKTWDEPIAFPLPADGNIGLTEAAVAEIAPGEYLAAIRTDEAPDPSTTPRAFDGFYFSRSTDGMQWSPPESLGERGRMPRFYRFGELSALAYRLYDGSQRIQYSALRFSRDGKSWTDPVIIEEGVAVHPELARVNGKLLAFNYQLPYGSNTGTRNVVQIPDWVYEHLGVDKP